MVDIPAQLTFKRYSLDGTNKRNRRQKCLATRAVRHGGVLSPLMDFFCGGDRSIMIYLNMWNKFNNARCQRMEARKILAGESCKIIQFALWKALIWKWKQVFFSSASWKSNASVDGFSHRTLLQLLQSWILGYLICLITTLLSQYSWTGVSKGETRKSFGSAAALCIGLYKIILCQAEIFYLGHFHTKRLALTTATAVDCITKPSNAVVHRAHHSNWPSILASICIVWSSVVWVMKHHPYTCTQQYPPNPPNQ